MSDFVVRGGTTAKLGRIEGELKVGRNATIKAESGGKVVVTGTASFEGRATVDCDFECDAVAGKPTEGGVVKVNGDLTAHRSIVVPDSLEVAGAIEAEDVDVGGHLRSHSVVSKHVRVGGHARISGALEAESVESGGHLSALGKVKLANLHVGGHAEVGGGAISGSIQVIGHFTSNSSLEYGQLQTYGHLVLPANSKGEKLSVLGRVEFDGDASCKLLEVNGVAVVRGNCVADEVEVRGKLQVSGSLSVSRGFKVSGVAEVKKQLECQTLTIEGRLSADRGIVARETDLSGELGTAHGLKSGTIIVRRGARVSGPLVANQVDVGEKPRFGLGPPGPFGAWPRIGQMTAVEDVYGLRVRIGPYSRAKRVFAEEVQMEDGSVADQVTYTKNLKLPSSYHLHQQPQKAAKLPDPPL